MLPLDPTAQELDTRLPSQGVVQCGGESEGLTVLEGFGCPFPESGWLTFVSKYLAYEHVHLRDIPARPVTCRQSDRGLLAPSFARACEFGD